MSNFMPTLSIYFLNLPSSIASKVLISNTFKK
jgi:hypothetical protein